MSKTLTFELADEVAAALQEMAAKTGRPFQELALEWLMKYRSGARPALNERERQRALSRLRRYAGAASVGHATGAENKAIDADLARECGDDHTE